MKGRIVFVMAVMLSALVGNLWAQLGMEGWASPQSDATQGRYRSAADNFIRPDAYTGVSFDSFFSMASFRATNRAQLGYATKFGDTYVAAAYGGSFWANYTNFSYTEGNTAWQPGGTKSVPNYSSLSFNTGTPENRVALMLGIADMGFRLTFSSTYESLSIKEDFVSSGDAYKSYEAARGAITPQLAWSMAKDLTPEGIKPYVVFDLGFAQSYTKQEKYDIATTSFQDVVVISSNNHVDPRLRVGLGGYTFYKNDSGFKAIADLDYDLLMQFYSNEYSYTDGGKYKISKISGRNNSGALSEYSYFNNLITPSVAGQWSGGPLALRFKLNLPVGIISEPSTGVYAKANGDLGKNGADSTTTTVSFSPDLRLAAQWKAMSKLTLNIGGRINPSVKRETVETDATYTMDVKNSDSSSKKVTDTFNGTTNQLTAGVTFLPTSNMIFEVSSGVSNTTLPANATNNDINVFDTSKDGLLYFSNFLVSLKF